MDVFPFNADVLFLPFKLKANTTVTHAMQCVSSLFLPFKLKANTTSKKHCLCHQRLFLPFKLKANTTQEIKKQLKNCCFYLSIKEHKMFLC